jgi:crotonobetainyl-CoA:carnitine CoA-transferase CaiB-like acyl-CoA transferase
MVLDLRARQARQVIEGLARKADIFVTNLRAGPLKQAGADSTRLRAANSRLIYGQITGYGPDDAMAGQRSYDHGAFWAYSGIASLFTHDDGEPPQPAGGMGDRASGLALAGALLAALYARERTGVGAYVHTSLVDTGFWLMASEVSDVLASGRVHRSPDRRLAPMPTMNCFRTADNRWLWIQVMLPERDWPYLLEALDAPWLDDDPRFHGGNPNRLKAARAALVETLDELFRQYPLGYWAQRLTCTGLAWAPVRSVEEAVEDAKSTSSGTFIPVTDRSGGVRMSVNSPARFDGMGIRPATRAPGIGQDTDHVLHEYCFTDEQISSFRSAGTFGADAT